MRFLLLLLLTALAVPAAGWAQSLPYAVEMTGVEGDLRQRVEERSRLVALADDPPASLVALDRRAEEDVDRIREVLRSEGFYDARIDIEVAEGDTRPVPVRIAIDTGPEYTLQSYAVTYRVPEGYPPPPALDPGADLDLVIGQRARAQPVADADQRLLRVLAERGYPLAGVLDRRVVVDHAERAMRVTVEVDTGGQARFGEVAVQGLEDVDEQVIRRRIPWDEGEVFSVAQVETLRRSLQDTLLFSLIRISTGDELGEGGRIPMKVEVEEAAHRSIGAGVSWSSSEGFGSRAFWEHRNLLGGGERVLVGANLAETRNALDFLYREPDFFSIRQSLLLAATVEERRTEAFISRTIGTSAVVERTLTDTWAVSGGVAVERTFEEELGQSAHYTLVSFPVEARHDNTDDLLDPTRGNRMRLTVEPYVEGLGTTGFTRIDLHNTAYLRLREESPRLIAAGWARLGTIRGGGLDDVPADKRFYVGGGGSVRPFGFQLAGPVAADGSTPTGGLSAIGFGGEIRTRVTETIEIVPFIEAGRADIEPWPRFGDRLLWGGGLGVRYHTAIGPIRADVAVPFNPRPNIDDRYQVYLSLGQAF